MAKKEQFPRFPRPRDDLRADRENWRRGFRNRRSSSRTFFVPGFSVHRPVLPTEEVQEFVSDLKRLLPKSYKVRSTTRMGMTVLDQKSIINQFRNIDVQPEVEQIENTAFSLQGGLKKALYGVSRRLPVPTGRISAFGDDRYNRRQIGIEPRGWRGHDAKYADKDKEGKILPIPVLIREADIVYGHLFNVLGDHEGFIDGIMNYTINRTPHITVATKSKGGSISASEESTMAGIIEGIMPPSLDLFDPVTYLQTTSRSRDNETIFARRPTEAYRKRFTR